MNLQKLAREIDEWIEKRGVSVVDAIADNHQDSEAIRRMVDVRLTIELVEQLRQLAQKR